MPTANRNFDTPARGSDPGTYNVGPNPDATGSVRRYMDPANGREDIFVDSGDLFSWILA
jgi:hypothetical protein